MGNGGSKNQPSSKPAIIMDPSSSTNTPEILNYVLVQKGTSIPTKLPQKLDESCEITPNIVPSSATKFKYGNSINNVYESTNEFSQYGSTSLPKPNQPSSKPAIMSTGPSSSTNTQGTLNYVLVQKATSIPTKLPQKLDESCEITPNIVPSSATKFKYGNSINNVYESASEYSQNGSSSSPKGPKPHRPSSKPKDTHGEHSHYGSSSSPKGPKPHRPSSKPKDTHGEHSHYGSSSSPKGPKPHRPSSKPKDTHGEHSHYGSSSSPKGPKPHRPSSKPKDTHGEHSQYGSSSSPKGPKPHRPSSKPKDTHGEHSQYGSSSSPKGPKPHRPSSKPKDTHGEHSQYGSSSSPKGSKPHRPSSKPKDTHGKTNYEFVEKAKLPTYAIPEDLKSLFMEDAVPMVLKKTLTPSTYKEYFQTLLYAEDFYIEKWDGFVMENVTLELHEAANYSRGGNRSVKEESDIKIFVAFKMDSVPSRRPFLLSRDFVSVRPSGKETASFQGVIYGVVKSNLVLVEFEEDFHHQHNLMCKYDVKFSFNRVCLKRAHQAISAASDLSIQNFLFPDSIPTGNTISSPYIIEGPLSLKKTTSNIVHETILSRSGDLIRCNVIKIYHMNPSCRILICAPTNKTCDVITRSLQEEIPDIFRANAAFREVDGVPVEIFPNCRYKKECFSCPPLKELQKFKVVVSTFSSAFRLHDEGLTAGHFSHIFLVDASSTTEPEAMVALINLVDDETTVVVSGKLGNRSSWVRSNIGRRYGLMVSFFERIRQSRLYHSLDPKFITKLTDSGQ